MLYFKKIKKEQGVHTKRNTEKINVEKDLQA
jgi:hypothetical protein